MGCHRTFVHKFYFIYDHVKDSFCASRTVNQLCISVHVKKSCERGGEKGGGRSLSRCDRIRRSEEACFQ